MNTACCAVSFTTHTKACMMFNVFSFWPIVIWYKKRNLSLHNNTTNSIGSKLQEMWKYLICFLLGSVWFCLLTTGVLYDILSIMSNWWKIHFFFDLDYCEINKINIFLFVTYTLIQSITSSEMCSLHLTHPSAHTPGAVGSHCCLAQGSHLSRGQFLPEPRFKPTTSDYKSNALSIRPRLPH